MITADRDLVASDPYGYRVALIEAFRRRGIYPRGVRTLSEESLVWQPPNETQQRAYAFIEPYLRELKGKFADWDLEKNRQQLWKHGRNHSRGLGRLIKQQTGSHRDIQRAYRALGMNATIDGGRFQVHSVQPARRAGPDGQSILELVVDMTQQRPLFFDHDTDGEMPERWTSKRAEKANAWFRGGCTLLIDVANARVRYCIYKRIDAERRPGRQIAFQRQSLARSLRATYLGPPGPVEAEPFALLHRHGDDEYE